MRRREGGEIGGEHGGDEVVAVHGIVGHRQHTVAGGEEDEVMAARAARVAEPRKGGCGRPARKTEATSRRGRGAAGGRTRRRSSTCRLASASTSRTTSSSCTTSAGRWRPSRSRAPHRRARSVQVQPLGLPGASSSSSLLLATMFSSSCFVTHWFRLIQQCMMAVGYVQNMQRREWHFSCLN